MNINEAISNGVKMNINEGGVDVDNRRSKTCSVCFFLFIFKGNAQLLALLAVGRISRANRP